MVYKILLILSTATLGVFLGTQLSEAALIVPYWKSLTANDFFEFYRVNGQKLHQFYAPLTIASTILPILTLAFSMFGKSKIDLRLWLMTVFSILFFSSFFVYFKDANLSFAQRTITNEALPLELIKWGQWHWGRVVCETVAFICGLFLLLKSK